MSQINIDDVFFIITYAGDSRSNSMMAIDEIKNGNKDRALELLDESKTNYVKAHEYLSKIVTNEINSDEMSYCTMLAVHAQDHLSMATVALDFAKEIVELHIKMMEK